MPTTRWHGTTIETGFAPFAAPTALTARGRPMRRASSAYVIVVPAGIVAERRPDVALERRPVEVDGDGVERLSIACQVEAESGSRSGGVGSLRDLERSEAHREPREEARRGIGEAGGDEVAAARGEPERAGRGFDGGGFERSGHESSRSCEVGPEVDEGVGAPGLARASRAPRRRRSTGARSRGRAPFGARDLRPERRRARRARAGRSPAPSTGRCPGSREAASRPRRATRRGRGRAALRPPRARGCGSSRPRRDGRPIDATSASAS